MATQNHLPKSPRGDAAPALPFPGPEEYQQLLEAARAHFQPANPYEDVLVERMASHLWRMRRLDAMEAAVLNAAHRQAQARAAASGWQESSQSLLAEAFHSKEVQDLVRVACRQANFLSRSMDRTLQLLAARIKRPARARAGASPVARPQKRPAAK